MKIPLTFLMIVPLNVIANAQNAAIQPQFEVASVKPVVAPRGLFYARSGFPSKLNIGGARVTTRCTVFDLVAMAYGLQSYQVASAPDWSEKWTSTAAYDIEARAPGDTPPTHDQVRSMLQALLADRFQLKFHRESREMPVYNLVVDGGGPRIKPSISADPPKMEGEGATGSQLRVRYTNFPIAEFIRNVMPYFDRPLFDKTGLAGGFDITLEFLAQPAGMTATAAAALGAPEPGLPIVASIRGQLGLRVVAAKGPVEILVVDRAERPSGN